MDDLQLMRRYAEDGSQEAMRRIVQRHLPMVYATARRALGDAHLAEDVSQAVFLVLVRKAAKAAGLRAPRSLAGWLFHVTCYAAAAAQRQRNRRSHHEQRAAQMKPQMASAPIEPTWGEIEPRLNAALNRLRAKDREAIVLRYLEERSTKEVAAAMGTTEAAAKVRIGRALGKLRKMLGGKDALLSVAGLGAVLEAKAVEAIPAGLAEAVIGAVGTTGTAAAGSTVAAIAKGAMNMMAWAKLKIAAGVVALTILAGGGSFVAVGQLAGPGTRPAPAATVAVRPDVPQAEIENASRRWTPAPQQAMEFPITYNRMVVTDVEASLSFYTKLGFGLDGYKNPEPGQPLVFASMTAGAAHLLFIHGRITDADQAAFAGCVRLYYIEGGPEALSAYRDRLRAARVEVSGFDDSYPPKREFTVRDPDGYVVGFYTNLR